MIELPDFSPQTSLAPSRNPDGSTVLGRLTTTEEQRAEALDWIVAQMAEAKATEAKARIMWQHLAPTILVVEAIVEHLNGRRVYVADKVTELVESGAEVKTSEAQRFARLDAEIIELHERGML